MVSFSAGLFLTFRLTARCDSFTLAPVSSPGPNDLRFPYRQGTDHSRPICRIPCAAMLRLAGIFAETVAQPHCPASLQDARDGPSDRFPSVGILSR